MELNRGGSLQRWFMLLLFMGMCATGLAHIRYVTAFMNNVNTPTYKLYLATNDKPAIVTVTVDQPYFNHTVHIESNSSSLVTLDNKYMITEKQVTSKAILIVSDVEVTVFLFNMGGYSADAMTCPPVENLGTDYYISTTNSGTDKQFVVANGQEEEVIVNVRVSGSISYNGNEYRSGDTFSLTLNSRQAIQFQSSSDLTGTRVSSTLPVAVLSGQKCFAAPGTACDNLSEEMYPTDTWGDFFVAVPLLNHTRDTLTIVTSQQDTLVNIKSAGQEQQYNYPNAGSYARFPLNDISIINSSKPIMVTYLLQESKPNLVSAYDPFFVTVSPSLRGTKHFKFVTLKEYYNFLLIVTEAPSADGFYLDHLPLRSYNFAVRKFNDFSAFEVFLYKSEEQHEIYHDSVHFTIYVYGIEEYISYGYSMGRDTVYPADPLPIPTSQPEGTLICLNNEAEYRLPLSLVSKADLDILDIHLEDPLCQAVVDGNFAVIQIPFDGCGTNVMIKDDKTYYENIVYGTIPGTSVQRIEIPVRCEMEMNETLGTDFHPKVTDVVSLGHYNVSLKLYQNEAFTSQVEAYPYEVDLHGNLHVEFEAESDDENLQLLVENCKATPSLEDTQQIYNVIQRGCPLDSTLQTHAVDDQRLQRFSMHVFKFGSLEEVYLSCNVIICHKGTSPNRCTQGCLTQRHKRDINNSKVHLGKAKLSQGPIVFKSEKELQISHTVPSSLLVVVIGVMGLLAVLGLVMQKQYLKKKAYTPLQDRED